MYQRKFSNLQTQTEEYAVSETFTHQAFGSWTAKSLHDERPAPDAIEFLAPSPVWKRRNIGAPLRWYAVLDAGALIVGLFAAWWMAASFNGHFYNRPLFVNSTRNDEILRIAQYAVICLGVLLNFERKGHYRLRKPFWLEVQNVFGTLGVAMAIDGFLQFAAKQDFSRMSLVLGWVVAAFAIILARGCFRAVMRGLGLWQVSTLLVGSGTTAEDASAAITSERSLGYVITSQISNLSRAYQDAGRSWEKLCAQYKADYVVIALDGLDLAQAEEPMAQLMREEVPFSVSPPMRHIPVLGMVPQYFFNHDVMLLTHCQGLEQPLPRAIKRGFDILGAGSALIVFSPLLLIVAALVKMDGGPIFFAHKRIGFGGKTFRCLKFRSMVPNGGEVLRKYLENNPEARAEWQVKCKLRKDPRVTSIGKALRRLSLDELPQLINVVRGDMSLVGPRPIALAEVGRYNNDIAYYYRVRPGITGIWQVSGRNKVSYARRVQMDVWYVRNWSLWHDVAIICKTFPVLLKPTGAY